MSFVTGFLTGAIVGYFTHKVMATPTQDSPKAAKAGPKIDKTQSKPMIDRPYFIFEHTAPDYNYYQKGTMDKLHVCTNCYHTGHYMTNHYAGTCKRCGGKYNILIKLSGKWLPREGKWLLSDVSDYPYPEVITNDIDIDVHDVSAQIQRMENNNGKPRIERHPD